MPTLQGVAVLVTRPAQQAAPLCALLTAAGATVIQVPTLQIHAVGSDHPRSPTADAFDIVIFTSANAVRFGVELVARQGTAVLAAIGPATARALDSHGLHAALLPSGGFDSEHLLQHPQLQHPTGQRIMIITGRGGRELLQRRLMERGAHVVLAEVYERRRVEYGDAELAALQSRFAAGTVDIITATSADVAGALLELAGAPLRHAFDRVHWLVPGARVAQAVRAQGIMAPLIQADSAEDHDLLTAIVRWRAPLSGA